MEPRHFWRKAWRALVVGWWRVGSPVLLVLVASGVGVAPRKSWRLLLQVLHRVLSRVGVLWVMMLMLRVGGGAAVTLTLVALVRLMVRVLPAVLGALARLVMPKVRALQVMHWWMVLLVRL